MPSPSPNSTLWAHYQTEQLEVFAGSRARLRFLIQRAERLTHSRSLLNIGCGDGYLEQTAQKRNWKVVSVDPDAKSAERLRALGLDARCGTIQALPLQEQSVDVVICTEVFEHLTPQVLEAGLNEIRRVLKPDGLLIGTVPYRENLAENEVFCPECKKRFHRWGHEQSFDEAGITSVIGRHLQVHEARPVYLPAWQAADWKGKLSLFARRAFSWIGVHSSESNLLFVAARTS
ncbi:MAG TPA: class I SAM-dependent methyltransferase [Candidatus Angelobacter sp.]